MKAVVAAFNQEKALVGAFSVITNLRMELFEALVYTLQNICYLPNLLGIIIRKQAVDVIHQLLQLQFWNEAISCKGKDQTYEKWKVSLSIIYLPIDVESVEEFREDLLGRSSLHDVKHHLHNVVDH